MKEKKWVQHMSGQGDKWELSCDAAQTSNNKRDHWRIPFEKKEGGAQ